MGPASESLDASLAEYYTWINLERIAYVLIVPPKAVDQSSRSIPNWSRISSADFVPT